MRRVYGMSGKAHGVARRVTTAPAEGGGVAVDGIRERAARRADARLGRVNRGDGWLASGGLAPAARR